MTAVATAGAGLGTQVMLTAGSAPLVPVPLSPMGTPVGTPVGSTMGGPMRAKRAGDQLPPTAMMSYAASYLAAEQANPQGGTQFNWHTERADEEDLSHFRCALKPQIFR